MELNGCAESGVEHVLPWLNRYRGRYAAVVATVAANQIVISVRPRRRGRPQDADCTERANR